jgi:hypothetical protein
MIVGLEGQPLDDHYSQVVVVCNHQHIQPQQNGLGCEKGQKLTFDPPMMSHLYGNVNIVALVGVKMGRHTKTRAYHGRPLP